MGLNQLQTMSTSLCCLIILLTCLQCDCFPSPDQPTMAKPDDTKEKIEARLCSPEMTKEEFFRVIDNFADCTADASAALVTKEVADKEAEVRKKCIREVYSDFDQMKKDICSNSSGLVDDRRVSDCVKENLPKMEIKQRMSLNNFDRSKRSKDMQFNITNLEDLETVLNNANKLMQCLKNLYKDLAEGQQPSYAISTMISMKFSLLGHFIVFLLVLWL